MLTKLQRVALCGKPEIVPVREELLEGKETTENAINRGVVVKVLDYEGPESGFET